MAEATPEAKAAHFAAKTAVVAAAARTSVSSFAEADEETQNETVSSVAGTYETLHQDVANGVSFAELLDLKLDACVGGAPTVDDLNWSFQGAVSYADQLPCTHAHVHACTHAPCPWVGAVSYTDQLPCTTCAHETLRLTICRCSDSPCHTSLTRLSVSHITDSGDLPLTQVCLMMTLQ